ncbi:MAG: hypothetical protein JKX81_19335, partial [Arenicella sp.]|nr:hypothetical protein [Arenicella sp.]
FTAIFANIAQESLFCFVFTAPTDSPANNVELEINDVSHTLSLSGNGEYCLPIVQAGSSLNHTLSLSTLTGPEIFISQIDVATQQTNLALPMLNRAEWNERAVRKVLKMFAFGGQAFDEQITSWANMLPNFAITEMLNFSEHNPKLSPLIPNEKYNEPEFQFGQLVDFAENYLGSEDFVNLPMSYQTRSHFRLEGNNLEEDFYVMATVRGLNPFRQRIGFWETNYHLALSLDATVTTAQMAYFYDVVMEAHESGVDYDEVMASAAKTSAVAVQYGHENNEFINGVCFCNDDFAREIHQLYFGIFGISDPDYHENISIKNTSKMLTDMSVGANNPETVEFGTQKHHLADLTIFHPSDVNSTVVSGSNASEKIDHLMTHSIEHVESLKNLPIMIIEGLADDNLSSIKKQLLRESWALLRSNKNFLEFVRNYAISELFFDAEQSRSLTSFERAFYKANKFNIDNIEAIYSYRNGGSVGRPLDDILTDDELVDVFRPEHNVFGGQTSKEAASSASIFEKNYNRSADQSLQFTNDAYCHDCDAGASWAKDWRKVIPSIDGRYPARHVAEWLWKHAVGDLDDYTMLEEAHLLPILAATRFYHIADDIGHNDRFFDLAFLLCVREDRIQNNQSINNIDEILSDLNYCSFSGGYTEQEKNWLNMEYLSPTIRDSAVIQSLLSQLAEVELPLDSTQGQVSRYANRRINHAMSFIFATPFVFADENLTEEVD